MSSVLPINLEDLLNNNVVEASRMECKRSWDERTTGHQVIRTIAAFANDIQNLNGGYIVIGMEERNGRIVYPPDGIPHEQIDRIQKWIRGHCNRIDPPYQPIFSPEVIDRRHILVIWVPGSDIRPHRAPEHEKGPLRYYVRIGSETVDAEKNGLLAQLLSLTAKVPFDDRRAQNAKITDFREIKVREFLRDIRSGLSENVDTRDVYRKMRIAVPVNGYDVPKNVGLLFFSDDPEVWFSGAKTEVVQFSGGNAGNVIEEKTFRGGLHEQLKAALSFLQSFSTEQFVKADHSIRTTGWVNYPIPALREALVNAVYHRSYESEPEPIKVYLHPDRIEIISYPGPFPGILKEDLERGNPLPPLPARNRRIGEFLKELKLAEGRGTGVPKIYKSMEENGSPKPRFDFDESRTYFRVTLPAHPEYVSVSALRSAAYLKATGKNQEALVLIKNAWESHMHSATLAMELMGMYAQEGKIEDARKVLDTYTALGTPALLPKVVNTMIDTYYSAGYPSEAKDLLKDFPPLVSSSDALHTAIIARRMGEERYAHVFFERAGDAIMSDPRALQEFAQTKMKLASDHYRKKNDEVAQETNRRLLKEARELLERVLQMDTDRTRKAWVWRDLARVKTWLNAPDSEIESAYKNAIELLPQEQRFKTALSSWRNRKR